MAKNKKNANKTITVSPRCPTDANNANTNFFNPLNLLTVFKGLKIRKAFKPDNPEIFLPPIVFSKIKERNPTITTKKSNIFQ